MGKHIAKRTRLGLFAMGITILVIAGCASSCKVAQDTSIQRTVSEADALADFDTMWQIVYDTHFDPTFNGVDWQAVRDELRPQAADAQNRREIRAVMNEALGRLGQSHFGIIPEAPAHPTPSTSTSEPSTLEGSASSDDERAPVSSTEIVVPDDSASDEKGNADTGIDVRIIDGQAVVSSIRDDSPAQHAGVQTGWILGKIRSTIIADKLENLAESIDEHEIGIHGVAMVVNRLMGPEDSTIDLTFLDGDNNEIELEIAREPMPGEFVKFGNLPPMSTHLDWSRLSATSPSGEPIEIGVIKFNIWMMPIASKFEKAMYELRDVDGLIIDLRGNPGGIGMLSASISRFLMDEKGSLGTMKMRGAELSFNVEPVIVTTWGEPIDPFTGPIAVLTDSGTASTSEVFAGGLQSLGRIEVFGTRSAGMALPAGMDKLPSGDVLLHAIADFVTSTGYQLEYGGVVPDHPIPLTREDLLKGIDSPKHAAVQWIVESVAQ